jgi:hypothetical protein
VEGSLTLQGQAIFSRGLTLTLTLIVNESSKVSVKRLERTHIYIPGSIMSASGIDP